MVLAAFAVGLALQLMQAWAVGDQRWMGHHAAQFAAGAAVWVFATWPRARGFLRVVVVAIAALLPVAYVVAVFGWAPAVIPAGGWRSHLWWENPHLFGIMLASSAALASMLLTRARWTALLLWAAAIVVTVALWSRGPTLAIVLGGATWAWTRYGWRGRLRIAAAAVLIGAVVVVSVARGPEGWSALFGEGTIARFLDGSVVDPDGRGGLFARLRAHEAAWTIVGATWPWGAGHAGFGDAYRQVVAPDARVALQHAHHQVLQFLATGGPLGLVAWLLPLFAVAWGLGALGWWMLSPFLAVHAYLWGTEAAFLNSSAFYATWVAFGLARQAAVGAWPIRPPCVRALSVSPAPPPRQPPRSSAPPPRR